jgi:hypothetical protein
MRLRRPGDCTRSVRLLLETPAGPLFRGRVQRERTTKIQSTQDPVTVAMHRRVVCKRLNSMYRLRISVNAAPLRVRRLRQAWAVALGVTTMVVCAATPLSRAGEFRFAFGSKRAFAKHAAYDRCRKGARTCETVGRAIGLEKWASISIRDGEGPPGCRATSSSVALFEQALLPQRLLGTAPSSLSRTRC